MSTFHILEGFEVHAPWQYIQLRMHNPLRNITGTYCITIIDTGSIYIGSTNNLAQRIMYHMSTLRCNRHRNYKLQEAYNTSDDIEILVKPTETVNDAQALEQHLVDYFKDTGYLCNIAIADVTRSRLGRPLTDEHKRIIGVAHRGKPRYDLRRPMSETAKQQGSVSRKAFYQTEKGKETLLARSNPVTIDGIYYPSISEACRILQQSRTEIQRRYRISV